MQTRLWLALHFADLESAESLTRIAADFCLRPARRAWGLADPRPDEGDSFLFADIGVIDGVLHRQMVDHALSTSAAHVAPVLQGVLAFGWLFPGACLDSQAPSEILPIPGVAFLHDSQGLAYRTHEEIAYLAAGLLGEFAPPPRFHGSEPYTARPNPQAIADLRAMQDLIGRAVGSPDDFGDYRRLDTGLTAMDMGAAAELDEILRRDVHNRLIWLGDFEPVEVDDVPGPASPVSFITFDHGVVPAAVPESLCGLIAYDFVESLRLDRAAGRCHRCREAMLLTPQQSARARRGEPVFHPVCHEEHRLEYWRAHRRGRDA